MLPLVVSDGQIIGNGQRVCHKFRFEDLLARESRAKTTA